MPGPAFADSSQAAHGCNTCALWVPAGLSVGSGSRWQDGHSQFDLFVGAEISLIDFRAWNNHKDVFIGAYMDGVYDVRHGRSRMSLGPEIVLPMERVSGGAGVDLGPVAEWEDGSLRWGGRVRAFLTWAIVSPYLGVTRFVTLGAGTQVDAGILLKYPFLASN